MSLKPRSPRIILAAAIVIPGAGHVLLGLPQRGLMFLFFTLILGWVGVRLMPETASFVGRNLGGIFIYGFSVIDAYRISKVRYETWRHAQQKGRDPPVQ
jgi:hypothetical protein